jgi:hypothetical protein
VNGIAFLNWKENDCQYVSAHFPDRPTADAAAIVLNKSGFKVSFKPTPEKPLEVDMMASRIFFPEQGVGELSTVKISDEQVITIEVGDGRGADPEPFAGKKRSKR